jgi:hypothetical protein
LLRNLIIYLWKTACRMAIATFPVLFCVVWGGPQLAETQWHRASHLQVYPTQEVTIRTDQQLLECRADGCIPLPKARSGSFVVAGRGWSLTVDSLVQPVGVGRTFWQQSVLWLCGIGTRYLDVDGVESLPNLLIVRPSLGDTNLLWPYLNDLEASFWQALLVGTLLVAVLLKVYSTNDFLRGAVPRNGRNDKSPGRVGPLYEPQS